MTRLVKNIFQTIWKFFIDIPIVLFFVALFVCLGIAAATAYLYVYVAPSVDTLSQENIHQTTTLYDRTGQHVLYELYGEENRKIIDHDEIPDTLRAATLAAEDDAFYSHCSGDESEL
jgi:membrane carboxypeptidase/penicillin-binding protein